MLKTKNRIPNQLNLLQSDNITKSTGRSLGSFKSLKIAMVICFLIFGSNVFGQYSVGDFGSIASGNYGVYTTWGIWSGAAWTPASAGAVAGVNYPNKNTNVFILTGTTVVMTVSNSESKTLNVETGGKIWNNTATNCYLNIYGDIICNGIIGNGVTFDGLSLGIESVNCDVTGTGTFDVSRIRKNTTFNYRTKFNIYRDINIRFNSSSQVQIYNNSAPSRFDVTVGVGATLNLTASGALTGNAAIDGDLVGGGSTQSAGSFTIDGTMIVTGTTYFVTNNTGANLGGITSTAGSTTVTAGSTATLVVGSSIVGTGAASGAFPFGTVITSIVNATTFTVSNPANTTTVGFTINSGGGCYWIINNGGILRTGQVSTASTTFNCTTVIGSTTVTTASTANLTVGIGISGPGIPIGATVTAIVNATTFTISSAAGAPGGSSSMSFYGGNAGHLLRMFPGSLLDITGTSGFNAALATSNSTWDIQNGSYTEFSAPGNQNVPLIPASTSTAYGSSTNFYGYLKISGGGVKNMFNSGLYNIANDLNIVNSSGTPVLSTNNQNIQMLGGNWYNYNMNGFDELLSNVFFKGSTVQTINTPGGERFFRLTYSKTLSSYLQFNCPVFVNNLLTWGTNGPVFLNNNRLTIENPASTSISNGANSLRYIISETIDNSSIVQWNIGTVASASSYVIPFGKPGVPDYIPFTYAIPTGTTVGDLSVATYGTPPNNLPWPVSPYIVNNLNSTTGLLPDNRDATVDRFWEIDVTAATPPTATVTFTYASTELPIAPFNNMTLMVAQWYNSSTDKWIYPISGQSTGTYSTTTPGLNTYGAWTLAAITSPLPIKLLSFSAKPDKDNVALTWTTATEINNDYFTIERSYNGNEFTEIAKVKGAGNSTSLIEYNMIDNNPLPGVSYYRLKQTDFDNQFSYSNIVSVRFSSEQRLVVQAGPNPAKDILTLTCFGGDDFSAELYEMDGSLVKQFETIPAGISDVNISDVSKGMYILRVNSNLGQKSLRIVKE